MFFDIQDEAVRKKARRPHELSMLNLAAFHLLAAPLATVLGGEMGLGLYALFIPLFLSFSVIGFTWYKASSSQHSEHWFVSTHWILAAKRTKVLFVGYAISASILLFAHLVTGDGAKHDIMMVALTRVAIAPVVLTVMIGFVLESGSIYQAGRGEVPDGLVKKYPAPNDLKVLDQAPAL